ncbi:hypothetical protein [Ruania rhizosphaerae]|uniref:hypothetical protein n=1 Tax=Ruania rhizosphaerae TaxID=1840413 RepID=UPI001357E41E|nr:hypothetical protein [Ruania rhizosphaerae]
MGSDTTHPGTDVITLEPTTDPATGLEVYADPNAPTGEIVSMTDAGLVTSQAAGEPVELPRDRFAGDDGTTFDWGAAERTQDSGYIVSMEGGQLVVNRATGQGVELPKDRFASQVSR